MLSYYAVWIVTPGRRHEQIASRESLSKARSLAMARAALGETVAIYLVHEDPVEVYEQNLGVTQASKSASPSSEGGQ